MPAPSVSASGGPTAVGSPGTSPRTWSFNTGTPGAAAKLFVAIATGDDGDTVTAVTYGGVAMSAVDSVNGSTVGYWSLWVMDDPASGSNTLSVSYSGDGTYGGNIWWGVVEDAGTVGTAFKNSGTSNAPSTSTPPTCPTGGMLLCFARHAFSGSDPTISAGTSVILTRLGSAPHMLAYRTDTGAFTWGTASSQLWGVIGVPIDAAAGATITGDLAATEAGSDTAAVEGSVLIAGDLAATEAGSDTAAVAGSVLITGDLAAAEAGSDTAAVEGSVLIAGDLAATEAGSDTAVILGGGTLPTVTGYLEAAESGADTAAVAGSVLITGNLAAVESGSDTAAIGRPAFVQPVAARLYVFQPQTRRFDFPQESRIYEVIP